jgi:uncharacterized membrane protein YbhN (UPF0104 family)
MSSPGRGLTRLRPESLRRRLRLFATPADEPRARRATDVILLVGAVLALGAISLAAFPPPGFARAVVRFLASFPDFLDGAWQVLADLLVILAVVLVVAALVRRRGSIARDLLVAAVVAAIGWLLVGRVVEGSWPAVWDGLRAAEPPPWYPSPRIAVPAAVVITASPHVTLPMRRLGRWLLALAVFAVALLGAATLLGAVAGVLVAAITAAAVHLVFGSSGGRPGLELVRSALAELGVPTATLGVADRQQAGLFVVHATDAHGDPLVVKVYGRDAHDAALLSTLWRTVWYREPGSPLRLGRLQQVEHEAFLTLFARQAGVRTDTVVTAGATADDDALLVLRRSGDLLADVAGAVDHTAVVGAIWSLVDRMNDHGIAHGQLDDGHLLVNGGELGVVDFRGATVAASETQRRTDEVQAFVTTLALVGEDGALAGARQALGGDGLAAMLPYLQLPALTPRQRRQVRDLDLDVDQLRAHAAEAAGAEPPPLQQLRRISLGAIVRVVLPAVAIVALLSGLAGLDFDELMTQLRDATWSLVVVGIVVAQLARVAQATSTLGASPVPLPLGPVYALQLAVSYVNIAIPTAAARIAVNIRFFQRHGVPAGSALAAGGLDGFSGFIVQAIILLALLLLTPASLDLDLGAAVDSAGQLLLVAVVVAAVAIATVAAVGRWRRFVTGWARRLGGEALVAVRGLRSPRRIGLLFGGNLATELLFAAALATFTRALGASVGLDEALLVNISVALLAGLLPIPGGIGVAEGGLTFGLVQAGVPEEIAFAAVLLYRLWTFYLPPIWGYFALRWLERNEHL